MTPRSRRSKCSDIGSGGLHRGARRRSTTAPYLDIGTATGDLLVALRDVGFANVHGVDPSPDAARKAGKRTVST